MKRASKHVTSLQQSREFVTTTNLEAVNHGKNVGSVRPNLIGWGRERDRGRSHSNPRAAPISYWRTGGPDLWGLRGRSEIGPCSLGDRERPRSYHAFRFTIMKILLTIN